MYAMPSSSSRIAIDSQAARLAKYQDAADALTQQIDSLEMKTDGLDQLVKEDDVIGKNAEEVSRYVVQV